MLFACIDLIAKSYEAELSSWRKSYVRDTVLLLTVETDLGSGVQLRQNSEPRILMQEKASLEVTEAGGQQRGCLNSGGNVVEAKAGPLELRGETSKVTHLGGD